MRARRKAGSILLAVPVFAACAGGSGGNVTGPDTATVTPLVLLSTAPAGGSSDFPLNWLLTAHFAADLDSTSPASAFTVTQGGTPVAGTVEYEGADATFTPTADLEKNVSYTATLSTAVKGVDGSVMSTPHAWSFTTGDCERFMRVDSFPLGPEADDEWSESMTTDGTTIYLLLNTASADDYVTLMTIDPRTKSVTGSTRIPVVPPRTANSPPAPDGIAELLDIAWYDGALWASGAWYVAATQAMDGGVFKLNPATGVPEHTISLLTSSDENESDGVGSIASDGTSLYVSVRRKYFIPSADTTLVVKLDPGSATQISMSSPWLAGPTQVHQMDFGGGFLWVLTEEAPRRIDKVDPNTGETLGQVCVDNGGANILYVNGDFWSARGSSMLTLSLK